jgi:hypothetical protein
MNKYNIFYSIIQYYPRLVPQRPDYSSKLQSIPTRFSFQMVSWTSVRDRHSRSVHHQKMYKVYEHYHRQWLDLNAAERSECKWCKTRRA